MFLLKETSKLTVIKKRSYKLKLTIINKSKQIKYCFACSLMIVAKNGKKYFTLKQFIENDNKI